MLFLKLREGLKLCNNRNLLLVSSQQRRMQKMMTNLVSIWCTVTLTDRSFVSIIPFKSWMNALSSLKHVTHSIFQWERFVLLPLSKCFQISFLVGLRFFTIGFDEIYIVIVPSKLHEQYAWCTYRNDLIFNTFKKTMGLIVLGKYGATFLERMSMWQ